MTKKAKGSDNKKRIGTVLDLEEATECLAGLSLLPFFRNHEKETFCQGSLVYLFNPESTEINSK